MINARFFFRRHGGRKMMLPAALVLLSIFVAVASAADRYVAGRHPLPRIEPGTVIGQRAPDGWSHLIIKSQPRLERREAEKVHETAARLARLLFTVFVANVDQDGSKDGRRYRLGSVAVGLGTPIDGDGVIISSKTEEKQNANLDFIAGIVLSQSEKQLGEIVEIGRSATMSLFDAPGLMLRDDEHQAVILRHAVLVDPRNGRLETFVWTLDVTDEGNYEATSDTLLRLQPNLIYDCRLHVDSKQLIAGIPLPSAFAMYSLPDGQTLSMPPPLDQIAARRRMTPQHLERIEVQLRHALRRDGR